MRCARPKTLVSSTVSSFLSTTRVSFAPLQKRRLTIAELDAQRRGRERILILGSGWGGFSLSRALDPRKHQIVIVSPRTYFVFTPLLAGTSVGK